ncbi:Short-chain dehydrogenase/reductase family 16C member 6-like protein [Dinothrombium tinctorium]|uniref:Short-chain dehydrogenase/reductase 3 n=1 Tax=Dinothrombium tinctorium TaxID=1965070 RepID=A0A3S3PK72_9ACAR|nr:Short-chain dehydrogenase/reductase family 16C member 6-like protein [Dinothrombium tinctorium]RWS02964.1 Short-chain dehydrogenase/reductase family 16C member 6-like protein [Dinothrombium tinctorium]RWS07105.1 Short-chain dehydrogenase/reductase family 16C member 6-like protein [Dinothrombium tinctorium]RWS07228.1 Short-chain dehydrogenase/reductase family 16C member 6-like protein [Dinothrombium tinctorium]RWS08065.1 Short-chain dehydrogenase/reductase family 16C member 6-like protein [Di
MRQKLTKLSLAVISITYNWLVGIVCVFLPKSYRYKNVKNEIVLITGGGSGIGQQMAVRFAALGAKVVIWDINERGMRQTNALVKKQFPTANVFCYCCDVSKYENVYEMAKKVKQDVGIVTILINNAGMVNGKLLKDLDEKAIIRTMDVNFLAHFWTCKAFLPDMMATNHGHIVTIGSIAGLTGAPRMSDYSASKHATIGFEESLRYELKAEGYTGIHSTIVCPYFINTGMFHGARSDVLPFIDTDFVVDKIISAILINQEVLFIPKFMYFLYVLKSIMPSRALYALFKSLGGEYSMNNFVGRNQCNENGRGI